MHQPSHGRSQEILHLRSGGDQSIQIDSLVGDSSLMVRTESDPYRAMGLLARPHAPRFVAAIVDSRCLAECETEFPVLAMRLVAARAVYLYGPPGTASASSMLSAAGIRFVGSMDQFRLMIGELEHRLNRGSFASRRAEVPSVAPAGDEGSSPDDDSRADSDPEASAADRLRLVTPPTPEATIDPDADPLTEAASRPWPEPVLRVSESEFEPIARILPDDDPADTPENDEKPGSRAPTPWSPSPERPRRTPPPAATSESGSSVENGSDDARQENRFEPVLTPEELEALLGPGEST